ncbi:MAG TPA: hypothetical protein PKV39_00835 [bacterium]|nr:hypothetical protein [bacterium]
MDDSIQTLKDTTDGEDENHYNKSEDPNRLTSIANTEFSDPSNAMNYSEKKSSDKDEIAALYDLEECAESYVE